MQLLIASVMVLVSIFTLLFLYPIFSSVLIDSYIPVINDTIVNQSVSVNSTEVNQVMNNIQMSWIYGPVIMVVGMIVVLLIIASQKEYSREYV